MVVQSGSITPGHGVKWVTDNVIGDNGANPYSQRVLGTLLNADFNATTDQAINLPSSLVAFQLTGIIVTNCATSLTAAVGGFYPEDSKGGTPLVAASQVYTQLTGASLLLSTTLSSYAQQHRFSRNLLPDWAIYLSLTTAQGVAALADVYVIGIELA